jgi:hypothetical protein
MKVRSKNSHRSLISAKAQLTIEKLKHKRNYSLPCLQVRIIDGITTMSADINKFFIVGLAVLQMW